MVTPALPAKSLRHASASASSNLCKWINARILGKTAFIVPQTHFERRPCRTPNRLPVGRNRPDCRRLLISCTLGRGLPRPDRPGGSRREDPSDNRQITDFKITSWLIVLTAGSQRSSATVWGVIELVVTIRLSAGYSGLRGNAYRSARSFATDAASAVGRSSMTKPGARESN